MEPRSSHENEDGIDIRLENQVKERAWRIEHRGNTKKNQTGVQSNITNHITVNLTDVGAAPLPSLNAAIHCVLDRLYRGIPLPQTPLHDKQGSLDERNRLICARYAAGETLQAIA